MRLFVAIELPEPLKQKLAILRRPIPGARWVPANQLHLTLAFVGELPQEQLEPLCTALAEVRHPSFVVSVGRTGSFSYRGRPRVLWIGVEPHPALTRLAAQIKEATVGCGIPLEDRPFFPHISLARLKEPAPHEVAAWLDSSANDTFPLLPVREYVLYESTLTPRGAIHRLIRQFPLTDAADGVNG